MMGYIVDVHIPLSPVASFVLSFLVFAEHCLQFLEFDVRIEEEVVSLFDRGKVSLKCLRSFSLRMCNLRVKTKQLTANDATQNLIYLKEQHGAFRES